MTRAGNYVLGLMDDSERERAERDLEIDPSFRDAVVEIAERMHVFDRPDASHNAPEDGWKRLKDQISGMPQMRTGDAPAGPDLPDKPEAPVTFGRRRSDVRRDAVEPTARARPPIALHSVPGRLAMAVAAGLIAAFALGYLAGISSVAEQPPTAAAAP